MAPLFFKIMIPPDMPRSMRSEKHARFLELGTYPIAFCIPAASAARCAIRLLTGPSSRLSIMDVHG